MIVASAGGAPTPPAWWHNVQADPRVVVQIGCNRFAAQAVAVTGTDREVAWRRLAERNRHLPSLEREAGRGCP